MTDVNTQKEPEQVSQEDLNSWFAACQALEAAKAAEIVLRRKIAAFFFRDPKEGTNKVPLADGWVIKMQHVVNRTVDVAALTNLGDEFAKAGLRTDVLLKYKPEVQIANYRTLTDEQRNLFDQALTIKPGTPQLEIVKPKRG